MPDTHLHTVTELMLTRVEDILRNGQPEPQAMKHLSAVLKDIREIRRDTLPDAETGGIEVRLAPEVADFAQ